MDMLQDDIARINQVQIVSPDLNPFEISWDVLVSRQFQAEVWLSHHQYKSLVKN